MQFRCSRRRFVAAALASRAALGAASDAFVRVSRKDRRYLELTDGAAYIPIGLNLIAPPREGGFEAFESWAAALARNSGNYIRVWLSQPFWDVEHERSGVYDKEKAQRIDRMLALCRKLGLRVKLTMEHFRSVGGGTQAWADKPLHHVDHGGTAKSIADFFDGEPSRARFRQKIAWYADRYGSRPEVFGWELWNEINAVRGGDYLAWTEAMLPELHRAFPKNLCMQSLGSFDRDASREAYRRHSRMAGNDLAQVHRYLDLGAAMPVCHGPVDELAADAIGELIKFDAAKPAMLAESGAVEPRHTGPFRLYVADRAGIILHDVLFAPFFSGAAGPGQIWHWDAYVAANGLWGHFARFAAAIGGVDPIAEVFQAKRIRHERLRIYALEGRRTTLLWCRDSANTWQSELRDGQPPETLRSLRVPLPGKARAYDPWTNEWTDVEDGRLPAFSRSLVLIKA